MPEEYKDFTVNAEKRPGRTRRNTIAAGRKSRATGSLPTDNTSGYAGVSPYYNGWIAKATVNGKQEYIGMFPNKVMAAKARDKFVRKTAGTRKLYNFPRSGEYSAITGTIEP